MISLEAATRTNVPVCSVLEMGAGEQRATVPIPPCCSEHGIKREEAVIGTPTTDDAIFEESRSSQFSSSGFASSR